jgi:serine/threonine protein kinase
LSGNRNQIGTFFIDRAFKQGYIICLTAEYDFVMYNNVAARNDRMMAQTDALIAGRYRMGRLLGSGGFGAVYLATDERLHRPVAIKVCSTQRLPTDDAAEAARLFQSEALTLARLRHPGLTAIWDYFNQDNEWYLVMEYVPGETLRDLMRRVAGPLPQAEALNYARQLCAVLTYLHQQYPPVVFRDLKPGNVMVTPEGQLKLIDFGIARLFSPGKIADTAQFGTPGYAPPEQYGGQTEPRSDIFSLGVLLHQMLTGHNPASSPFALPPARSLNPTIPPALESLIAQATAYEIADRVASAAEFCSALETAIARPMPAATAPVPRIVPQHSAPQQTGPITSRQLWSPSPRQLPSRPQGGGAGRGIVLILLLVVLLGSLGTGAYLLQSQIAGLARDIFAPSAVSAPLSKPLSMIVFSVPWGNQSENLYLKIGNEVKTLTNFPPGTSAALPSISPDGMQIAFTRVTSDGNQQIWLIDTDGRNLRPLLKNGQFGRAPEWSPDGSKIVFETAAPGSEMRQHDLAIADVRSGKLHMLTETTSWEGGPTWSPDGTRIAFHARSSGSNCMQIYIVDVASRQTEQLSKLDNQQCRPQSEGEFWPDWSPNGRQLAFGHKLNGREQLAIFDISSKELQILDTGSLPAGHPRWSADGKQLLFHQAQDDVLSLAHYDIKSGKVTPIDTSHAHAHLADWR